MESPSASNASAHGAQHGMDASEVSLPGDGRQARRDANRREGWVRAEVRARLRGGGGEDDEGRGAPVLHEARDAPGGADGVPQEPRRLRR
eukprot:14451-Pelagococcus_subviridis.AAC.1